MEAEQQMWAPRGLGGPPLSPYSNGWARPRQRRPGGRRALLNPAPSLNRIPLGTIPADLSPRSSHAGRQAAPPGVSRPAPTLPTTPRIRLPASASQGVTDDSFPCWAPGQRGFSPRPAGRAEAPTDRRAHRAGGGRPESQGRARARTTSPLGQESPAPPGAGGGRRGRGPSQASSGLSRSPVTHRALTVRGSQGTTGPGQRWCAPEKHRVPPRKWREATLTRRRPRPTGGPQTQGLRAPGLTHPLGPGCVHARDSAGQESRRRPWRTHLGTS